MEIEKLKMLQRRVAAFPLFIAGVRQPVIADDGALVRVAAQVACREQQLKMGDRSPRGERIEELREIRAKQELRRSLRPCLTGTANKQRRALAIKAGQVTDYSVSQMF